MKNSILIIISTLMLYGCVKDDPVFDESYFSCVNEIINTHPDTNRFQSFLEDKVNEGLPGISMLIETPEGIWTGASGVADIPNNISMQPCGLHRIGSITKSFTATLILQLYEQGQLHLDDPISMYLEAGVVNEIANADVATIRQLLSHTSGIADYLDQIDYTFTFLDNPTKVWTAREELEFIYDEDAEFTAGSKVKYSNTNYLLLGLIAENIAGLSGTQLYQEMIFNPLGMNATHFNQNGEIPSNQVRDYFDESGNGSFIDITPHKFANHSMAGGASSTVMDLHNFLKTALTTNLLFTDDTIEEMLTNGTQPFDDPDDFEYGEQYKVKRIKGIGLGWFEIETEYGKAYGHDGGFNGRRARMWYFPDSQKSIVFLVNGSGESIKPIHRELRRNEMVELLFE